MYVNIPIVTRLIERFRIKDIGEPGINPRPLKLINELIPVTVVDDHVKSRQLKDCAVVAGGAGYATCLTVPANERWLLHLFYLQISANTLNGINITDTAGTTKGFIVYTGAASISDIFDHPIPVEPGWYIQAQAAGGGGNITGYMLITKETIYA